MDFRLKHALQSLKLDVLPGLSKECRSQAADGKLDLKGADSCTYATEAVEVVAADSEKCRDAAIKVGERGDDPQAIFTPKTHPSYCTAPGSCKVDYSVNLGAACIFQPDLVDRARGILGVEKPVVRVETAPGAAVDDKAKTEGKEEAAVDTKRVKIERTVEEQKALAAEVFGHFKDDLATLNDSNQDRMIKFVIAKVKEGHPRDAILAAVKSEIDAVREAETESELRREMHRMNGGDTGDGPRKVHERKSQELDRKLNNN